MTALAVNRAADRARRTIITPEGVPLHVELAGRDNRAAAFLLDFLIIIASVALLFVVTALVIAGTLETAWASSFFMLAWFLIRTFYFTFFELRWQGRTPGKKALKLRVIDREGGPLRSDAVVARNFMREVEVFLPFWAVLGAAVEGWMGITFVIWVGIMALMPLFNRDRLRVGDIVAGTWVITVPRSTLLPDLADAETAGAPAGAAPADPASAAPRPAAPALPFTPAQLDAYGIYELHVLEDVLRRADEPETASGLDEIAGRIQRKIAWTSPAARPVPPREFLEAYYVALRAHLEKKMLLGERRESKHYGAQTPSGKP